MDKNSYVTEAQSYNVTGWEILENDTFINEINKVCPWSNDTYNITCDQSLVSNNNNRTIYDEETAARYLYLIFCPCLFLLGTVGNCLVLATISCRKGRTSSIYLFLLVLAVTDLIVLYTGLLRYWIISLSDIDIRDFSDWGCKLHLFLLYTSMDFSSWILVSVTIERFIGIYYPLHSKTLFTTRHARVILVVLLVVIVGVNFHFFWTNGLTEDGCGSLNDEYYYFDEYIFTWIDFVVLSVVPFTIMSVCNVFIIVTLRNLESRQRKLMRGLLNKSPTIKSMSTTHMLIAVSVVFLLTTLPPSVYLIVEGFILPTENAHPQIKAHMTLTRSVVMLIQYVNYSVNFYLYYARGTKFRKRFMKRILKRVRYETQ